MRSRPQMLDMAIGGNADLFVMNLTIEVDVGPAVFQCCFGSIIHWWPSSFSPWDGNAYFVSLYTRNMQYSFILQGYTDKLPLWISGEMLKVRFLTSIKMTVQSTIIVNEISKWLTMKYFIIDNLHPHTLFYKLFVILSVLLIFPCFI